MDTPDKAADLANSTIADSVNKEWLVSSARSSQLSASLRQYQLELSTNSGDYGSQAACKTSGRRQNEYGGFLSPPASAPPAQASSHCNEKSWLLRHYRKAERPHTESSNYGRRYTLKGHLYDNISFADSPILARSLSLKRPRNSDDKQHDVSRSHESAYAYSGGRAEDQTREGGGFNCCSGKYRIFLSCYVLLGITMAIYSRNALSLAAVGMVANNVANKELVDILSQDPRQTNSNPLPEMDKTLATSLDGSCPVLTSTKGTNSEQKMYSIPQNALSAMTLQSSTQINGQQWQNRSQIEKMIQESIDRRVSAGELVDWSPAEQGLIFAAGSVGNLLIAIPITRMGEIYGPKWIIFVALLGATLQAALMPTISPYHISLVLVFQVIFNGLTFGADCVAYTLFAHWLTPTEMAFFVGCLIICYQLGTIISSSITAYILTQGLGWGWCFYTPAILCGLWTLSWMFLGASQPSSSWLISEEERVFLQRHSKISRGSCLDDESVRSNTSDAADRPVSWLKLAKDPNIWAIIAVKFSLRWYFSVYLSLMPTFLYSVAHMSVDTIGKMNVFQSVIGLVSGILLGYLTRSVVSKRPFNVSLATFRKTFQSIVNFGLSLTLLVFMIYDCNQIVTIITLTLGGICINFYVAAALQLPLDLSPHHCGLITSITNTLALGQALGAPVSGLVLEGGPKYRNLWRTVWGVSVLLNTFSGLLFIILVDSKPRDYSKQISLVSEVDQTNTFLTSINDGVDDDNASIHANKEASGTYKR